VSADDGVIQVAVDHRFAVPLREGFDYITDPANWPKYWPGLVAIEPGRVGGSRAIAPDCRSG
jgi:hypothetical protein